MPALQPQPSLLVATAISRLSIQVAKVRCSAFIYSIPRSKTHTQLLTGRQRLVHFKAPPNPTQWRPIRSSTEAPRPFLLQPNPLTLQGLTQVDHCKGVRQCGLCEVQYIQLATKGQQPHASDKVSPVIQYHSTYCWARNHRNGIFIILLASSSVI